MMNRTSIGDHIVSFSRVLRHAGVPVGTSHVLSALEAAEIVGPRDRSTLYHSLFATLVSRPEHRPIFEKAFHLFWRAPKALADQMQMVLPSVDAPVPEATEGYSRIREAMQKDGRHATLPITRKARKREEVELDLVLTFSDREVLAKKDFADFSLSEMEEAKRIMNQLRFIAYPKSTRRKRVARRGAIDLASTLRAAGRTAELAELHHRTNKRKPRPIVVLCDISGSMERYSRMLLQFMHTISSGMKHVESFVFATRLTRITRQLRARDVDDAIDEVSREVKDWSGGTRLGKALSEFNHDWLRRVVRSGSICLLITDGWDRGETEMLELEMGRLSRSCHELIWLNPLLGYDEYQPITKGVQAMMPYVDRFLPVHNLESMRQLASILGKTSGI